MPHQLTPSELEAINSFPQAAEEFCHLIENESGYTRRQFVENVLIYLSKLWALGSQLPDVEPATAGNDFSDEEVKRHSERCIKLSNTLRIKLGDLDTYWSVFNPTKQEQSTPTSLSVDLAEIYMDLKEAVKLLASSKHINDIYWEWGFAFREHWARHAVEALKVTLFISPLA
jgi:hypothetical protein